MCKEHTDVNDPLLDSWLASVPVIPEAQLHFWALVILKHGHHHCLKWRKEGDKKSRKIRFICLAGTYFFTPARISKNSPSSRVIHHSKSFLSPKLSPVICVELACVCVYSYPRIRLTKKTAVNRTTPSSLLVFLLSVLLVSHQTNVAEVSCAALWPHCPEVTQGHTGRRNKIIKGRMLSF